MRKRKKHAYGFLFLRKKLTKHTNVSCVCCNSNLFSDLLNDCFKGTSEQLLMIPQLSLQILLVMWTLKN